MGRALLLSLVLVGSSACAGASWEKAPKVVFPITVEEADKVMYGAMVEEFGVASIHRVTHPEPGYRYAETTIVRVTARGRTESGEVVTGFAFRTQGHRSEAVARNISQLGARFAAPLPLAR